MRIVLTITLLFCLTILGFTAKGQGEVDAVGLTGFLRDAQTQEPIPYAHIIIPDAGLGVSANYKGEFTLKVFPGDSLIITAVGYRTSYYNVPRDKKESYAIVIPISEEVNMLPPVEVFPYPTEQAFKEAFLALEMEDERTKILRKNLEAEAMAKMSFELGMDGYLNYKSYMNAQSNYMHNQTFLPTLQLLNPFAWAQFIKSVKNGDFKKGKYEDYMKTNR